MKYISQKKNKPNIEMERAQPLFVNRIHKKP